VESRLVQDAQHFAEQHVDPASAFLHGYIQAENARHPQQHRHANQAHQERDARRQQEFAQEFADHDCASPLCAAM
jgi:hypothetical protein